MSLLTLGQLFESLVTRDLVKLASKIDQTVMGPPAFPAVIYAGRFAARLSNRALAIPLGCLGA